MRHLLPLLTAPLLSPFLALEAANAFLVENGQPLAEIVIAEKPARMTKLAAKELQGYVAKMLGAKVPVVTERSAGKAAIFVGASRFTVNSILLSGEKKNSSDAFGSAAGHGTAVNRMSAAINRDAPWSHDSPISGAHTRVLTDAVNRA